MLNIISQLLYLFTKKKQLDFAALEKHLGLPGLVARMNKGQFNLSQQEVSDWFDWLKGLLNVPYIGLQVAYFADLSNVGAIGHLIQSCKTIRDANKLRVQWTEINNPYFRIKITEENDLVTFEYIPDYAFARQNPAVTDELIQASMTFSCLSNNKMIAEDRLPLKQVSFTCATPEDDGYFRKVFNIEADFEATRNVLVFDRKWFDSPVISYNKELFDLLRTHISEELDPASNQKLGQAIKNDIIAAFRALRDITLEDIAEMHTLSIRSVQRSLKQENTSFRQLRELAREELSLTLLRGEKISIKEVTYLLGYSSVSAFSKAFKRWSGMSPTEYQQQ